MKEFELVNNYIKNNNNKQIRIFKEIGYRKKNIDVVEFDPKSEDNIHGIEFKIKNWKLGFRQCLGNRILVPYNSLAIYHKYLRNINKELLIKYGIGLISLDDGGFKIILTPKKSEIINQSKFNVIKKKLILKSKVK